MNGANKELEAAKVTLAEAFDGPPVFVDLAVDP